MLAELYQITGIVSNICFIALVIWLVKNWIQAKKYFYEYMDDIDSLLNQDVSVPQDNKTKERLIQVVASGRSKQYLGRLYSTEEIEKLDDKELAKLYARYEAVLGGQITLQLKQHMIYAYTRGVEFLCPTVSQGRLAVYNTDAMCKSLNDGPFTDLALTSLTCKLYHEYGHFLAPLEAALLTSNYVHPANSQQATQQTPTSYQQNLQRTPTSYQQPIQQTPTTYRQPNQHAMQQQQIAMQQRAMQQLAMQQTPTTKPN